MFLEVVLLLIAFLAIWLSTGFAIEAIEKISTHSTFSRFTLSLFVIGAVTSFPELSITINSVLLNSPQIALGNLIGSQIFLLFFVIPVLAILSKGLHLRSQMKNISLGMTLLVAVVPIVALLNQKLELAEALVILGLYLLFIYTFARHESLLEKIAQKIQHHNVSFGMETVKLLIALGVLLLASNAAVRAMIELAAAVQTPRFLLSLLILPIGTNLPELSLALGSLAAGKKNFAISDYMGSITFNSLLIGILALSYGGISIGQNIGYVVVAFLIGVIVLWWCCFSREILSIKEGLLLLMMYFFLLLIASWQIMSGIYAR